MRQILLGITAFFCLAGSALAAEPAQSASAQPSFQEGIHYLRLANPQPGGGDQIEVIEFFWYGCPHCADFDPYMQRWKDSKPAGVKVTLLPAIFRPDWAVGAQAYYALEMLDAPDKVHAGIFDHIHKKRKPYQTPEHYAEIVAELGVDRQKFLDAMQSFAVDAKTRRAAQMIRDYRIQGVPTVAVNGKYTTSGSMAGSYQNILRIIDYLVALEKGS